MHFLTIFAGSCLHRIREWLISYQKLATALIFLGLYIGGYDTSAAYMWLDLNFGSLPFPLPDLTGKERLLMNIIGALFIVCGVLGSTKAAGLLTSRVPTFLGRISFSSYLIHWPIICSFTFATMGLLMLDWGFNHELAAVITIPLTIGLILMISHFYERLIDSPSTSLANWLSARFWDDKRTTIPIGVATTRGSSL